MNNETVEDYLISCKEELEKISGMIEKDVFNTANNYLTKYCIIRSCGTIEQAFKDIIVDFSYGSNVCQVINYIENKIKKSSMNPSLDNMNKLLKDFDESWSAEFKKRIEEENKKITDGDLKTSLKSLNNARNNFAHGGNPTVGISDILKYFNHAAKIIEIYDSIVNNTYD